jgi:hypothetical protein
VRCVCGKKDSRRRFEPFLHPSASGTMLSVALAAVSFTVAPALTHVGSLHNGPKIVMQTGYAPPESVKWHDSKGMSACIAAVHGANMAMDGKCAMNLDEGSLARVSAPPPVYAPINDAVAPKGQPAGQWDFRHGSGGSAHASLPATDGKVAMETIH